jgi:hypothetical protein
MFPSSRRVAFAALLTLCVSRVGATQATEPPAPVAPRGSESALPPEQRLLIHGYFSQAYANSEDHQLIGIPDGGTFDYRRMAVLFRGNITRKDALVVQLAQRRLGDSPTMSLEPDVKVDWTFYEHRFNSGTSVRVGRIPNPLGIFSEIRYVGTLLPLYRAPYNFYQEGSFTSENVNGARLTQTLAPSKPWNGEVTVFGGGFSMIESYAGQVNEARTNNALGGQLWLNTPVDGLRFGIGGDFFDTRNTILTSSGKDKWKTWIASGELSRTRLRLRAEYSEIHLEEAEFVAKAFYVYGGVNLSDKLVAHAQYDDSKAIIGSGDAAATLPKFYRDATLGLSYAFTPSVVAKAEHHWAKGRLIEDEAVPLDPSIGPFQGNYYILSLSASF